MQNKQTKLLFESWRAFLKEANPEMQKSTQTANKISSIMSLPYAQFVQKFKDAIADPKVLAVVKAGLNDGAPKDDDEVSVEEKIGVPVKSLRPTQNEVVFDKSLGGPFGPLQKADVLELFLKGGDVIVPAKEKAYPYAVTAEQKYIIDGHHRWSSLFCINPDAKIVSTNLQFKKQLPPMTYLKVTQMAIAADKGQITTATGGGVNLFTTTEDYVKSEVPKQIEAGKEKEKIMQIFAAKGMKDMDSICKFIWGNIQQLQNQKPVSGAPIRDVMPQTDPAHGFAAKLKSGMVNFNNIKKTPAQNATAAPEAVKESVKNKIRQIIREEIKKIKNETNS